MEWLDPGTIQFYMFITHHYPDHYPEYILQSIFLTLTKVDNGKFSSSMHPSFETSFNILALMTYDASNSEMQVLLFLC